MNATLPIAGYPEALGPQVLPAIFSAGFCLPLYLAKPFIDYSSFWPVLRKNHKCSVMVCRNSALAADDEPPPLAPSSFP